MLGAIVVPCNAGEKDQILTNLRLWADPLLKPFAAEPKQKPKLVFVFNNASGRDAAKEIEAEFEERRLGRHFSSVVSWFLDLTGKADAYIRDYTVQVDEDGYKAGPNNQFFKTIRAARDLGRYIFLMESDCIPIRSNWLGRLCEIVNGPEKFFVLGSAYRGSDTLGQQFNRHINGNAVYAVGDSNFQYFLDTFWEPELRRVVRHVDRRIAYDCVLDMLFSSMQSNFDNDAIWPIWQSSAHLFRYSPFIQNLSGKKDIDCPSPDMIKRILKEEPETFIIHSQAVARAASLSKLADPESWCLIEKEMLPRSRSDLWTSPGVIMEGDFYRLKDTPSDAYIACMLRGSVHKGSEVIASVDLTLREPARLSIAVNRQGVTPFEGSVPTILNCSAGRNHITVSHRFKESHVAARVQIASVSGPTVIRADSIFATRKDQPSIAMPAPSPAAAFAFVLGNGPSLKSFDFRRLDGFDSIGLNAAYRFWDRIDWYPSYYSCLDDQLIETHHNEIDRLYENGLVREIFVHGKFFDYHPNRLGNPSFLSFDQVVPHWYKMRGKAMGLPPLFDHPAFKCSNTSKITTGAYAVRFMAYKGYANIALMGIDLKYIERLPESEETSGVGLVMRETPKENPNYFFDDYQRAGDRYNIPNPDVHAGELHPVSFEVVREDFLSNKVPSTVVNTNRSSLLAERGIFPLADLDAILKGSADALHSSNSKTTGSL